jgi:antitoxin component of MazEF toxin-antitoxin module
MHHLKGEPNMVHQQTWYDEPDEEIEIEAMEHQDEYTLEELLAQITDENQHEYIDTGPAIGNEYW